MKIDGESLSRNLTKLTGVDFELDSKSDKRTENILKLNPSFVDPNHTFSISIEMEWKTLDIRFQPGQFASQLLSDMSNADEAGRALFVSTLSKLHQLGAKIEFHVNSIQREIRDNSVWGEDWRRLSLSLTKGQVEFSDVNEDEAFNKIVDWTCKFVSAVLTIIPFEEKLDCCLESLEGFPEGGVQTVQVNRYERERRNRIIALSLHGHRCAACDFDFGEIYGNVAEGYIQIHHTTPISEISDRYCINPETDLIPLCSNCHSVVHLKNPPHTIDEIKALIKIRNE